MNTFFKWFGIAMAVVFVLLLIGAFYIPGLLQMK